MQNQPQQTTPYQSVQPPSPLQPEPTPAPHSSRRKSVIKVLLLILLIIVLVGGAAYGTYAWQHKKVNSLNTTVTSLQNQVNSLNQQLQKAKKSSTTSSSSNQSSDPTAGWKSYTLQQEKLTFKYPSTWSLVPQKTAETGDSVILAGPNNAELSIDDEPAASLLGCPSGGCNVVYADPITFIGQDAYLDSYSGSGMNPIINTSLSKSSTEAGQFFPTKNVKNANNGSASSLNITFDYDYNGTSSKKNQNPKPLSYVLNDTSYKNARLIIESMKY